MQNKKLFFILSVICSAFIATHSVRADEYFEEEYVEYDDGAMEQLSADAVANYQPDGSLFQQITSLEQEKVLMQLEKERAQLDLELDRLAAEKIKLHMEIDTLSGRAEQQQQEIETQKAKLEAEAIRLEREKESLIREAAEEKTYTRPSSGSMASAPAEETPAIAQNYRLVNVIGAGSQLQATIENLATKQTKRISVGKKLDDFSVKSISLEDGVVFVAPDGSTQTLNVTTGNQ